MTTVSPSELASRAVQRRVEAGSSVMCTACDQQVKFAAKQQRQQVIANVYLDGRWARVEHYHAECYQEAGEPHGTPAEQVLASRAKRSSTADPPQPVRSGQTSCCRS